MITKEIGERLNYYECLQLLDKAAEYGIIRRIEDDLLMYRKTMWSEGWERIPLTACADALASDINGQTYYREALRKRGVEMSQFCELKSLLYAMG